MDSGSNLPVIVIASVITDVSSNSPIILDGN